MNGQPELDVLLEKTSKRGYLWHRFRDDQHGPEVLAGVFHWDNCTDVLVLVDEKSTHAYRTPTEPTIDVFAPTHVHWWYGQSGMVWVLRALLTLPSPHEQNGLSALVPAPKGTGVPGDRVPVRIRSWLGH
ncbi:hypothetical protein [Actinophytocola sediminis]